MPLTKDSREFVECLRSNKVDFLIVGALAVSWHGFPRYSGDIDFFVRPDRGNAQRLMTALEQFGFGGLGITLDDLSVENRVIQLGLEPNRIDLMTSISGVSFEEAWGSRVAGALDGIELDFIGREALVRNKRAAGRSKDLIDVEELTRDSARKFAAANYFAVAVNFPLSTIPSLPTPASSGIGPQTCYPGSLQSESKSSLRHPIRIHTGSHARSLLSSRQNFGFHFLVPERKLHRRRLGELNIDRARRIVLAARPVAGKLVARREQQAYKRENGMSTRMGSR